MNTDQSWQRDTAIDYQVFGYRKTVRIGRGNSRRDKLLRTEGSLTIWPESLYSLESPVRRRVLNINSTERARKLDINLSVAALDLQGVKYGKATGREH